MKGVYVLIVSIKSNARIYTGALGTLEFKKGLYAYVGSAQNNLEKRIERHLRTEKKKFWHIDYLLSNPAVKVSEVFHTSSERQAECDIARVLGETGLPIQGFGSSDCNCKGHLFRIKDYEFLRQYMTETSV